MPKDFDDCWLIIHNFPRDFQPSIRLTENFKNIESPIIGQSIYVLYVYTLYAWAFAQFFDLPRT